MLKAQELTEQVIDPRAKARELAEQERKEKESKRRKD